MADVAAALGALGIQEWVLRGEPTSEDEFKTMFAKVTGADSNGSAIESQDPADWGTTWAAITEKQKQLTDARWDSYLCGILVLQLSQNVEGDSGFLWHDT